MTRHRALLLLRIAALFALAVSAALFVDYRNAVPTFCALGSGCDVVRHSAYSHLFDTVPVPVLGMVSFGSLLWFSLQQPSWARKLTAVGAVLGGLGALSLLSIQAFVLHAFCILCVMVDVSALVAGIAGVLLLFRDEDVVESLPPLCWIALAIAALGVPITYAQAKPPPPVPSSIVALWKPGAVNVIELSDFECPFCRLAHPGLKGALRAATVPVHFQRLTMPLPRHTHARDASRAYVCAARQGKAEEMADKLFATDDLTPEGCEKAALAVGVAPDAYRACLADPASERAVDADVKTVMATDFAGLPTIWIGDRRLLGVKDAAQYGAAIVSAAQGPDSPVGRAWPLAMVVVMAAGLFALGTRDRARATVA